MWKYLHLHGLHDVWVDTHLIGLASAQAADDQLGITQLSSQLGAAYLELCGYVDARECFGRSLNIARQLNYALGEQSPLEWLGKIADAEGQHSTASTPTNNRLQCR